MSRGIHKQMPPNRNKKWYQRKGIIIALISLMGVIITSAFAYLKRDKAPMSPTQVNNVKDGNVNNVHFDSSKIDTKGGDFIIGSKTLIIGDTTPQKTDKKKSNGSQSTIGNKNIQIQGNDNQVVNGDNNTVIKGDNNVIDKSKTTIINEAPPPEINVEIDSLNVQTSEDPNRKMRFLRKSEKDSIKNLDFFYKTVFTLKYNSTVQRNNLDLVYRDTSLYTIIVHTDSYAPLWTTGVIFKELKSFSKTEFRRVIQPMNGIFRVSVFTKNITTEPLSKIMLVVNDRAYYVKK
jgi:hypothetical protein